MLTPKQIDAWRRILCGMVGPYALMAPAEQIQAIHDNLQRHLDSKNVHIWHIKVRFDKEEQWENIAIEPKTPNCSLVTIRNKCWNLLVNYPKIDAIQIFDPEDLTDIHVFSREGG